jgi:hypothetical protein
MSDSRDGNSFLRKVVRFVANPTTDWHDLNAPPEDTRELALEKTELKAMVERKRRNDFVRKREFDTLRRLRREGLSPEQLAALGGSSRIDDSEGRLPESAGARADGGVKAKIDEIEQQMVGDTRFTTTSRKPPGFFEAPTEPAPLDRRPHPGPGAADDEGLPALPPLPEADLAPPAAPAPMVMGRGMSPLTGPKAGALPRAPELPARPPAPAAVPAAPPAPAVEVSEVTHDPDLDEAVIAFANADFAQCEQSLLQLTSIGGPRTHHAETWLVLFDLYRAIGEQHRFESLAIDYAHRFGRSAPQWYSLPRLVAEAVADEPPAASRIVGEVGWVCPELLDTEAVARLRSQALQMPLPWVFDWSALQRVEAEAATLLSALFRVWAGQAIEMRWMAGDRLQAVLQEAAPTGVRDADPAFWLAKLDALRLANRADQFDETAIDYCVTYEMSPPSWEPARCIVRISGSSLSTRSPPLSLVGEVSTSFMESALMEDSPVQQASVELSGQLVGDIGETLGRLDRQLGDAPLVLVSCARLIRVDFLAAGDLLNWVLGKRNESRQVQFAEAHRLVALFFGAMGINEHARVHLKKV